MIGAPECPCRHPVMAEMPKLSVPAAGGVLRPASAFGTCPNPNRSHCNLPLQNLTMFCTTCKTSDNLNTTKRTTVFQWAKLQLLLQHNSHAQRNKQHKKLWQYRCQHNQPPHQPTHRSNKQHSCALHQCAHCGVSTQQPQQCPAAC